MLLSLLYYYLPILYHRLCITSIMEEHYKELEAELSLARNWERQLNFTLNEDGATIDLLQYTQYQPDLDALLPLSNYPKGCTYQFDPTKYNGKDPSSIVSLSKDLFDAAITSGYMLTRKKRSNKETKSFQCSYDFYCSRFFKTDGRTKKKINSDDLADGTKIQFKTNHKRVSVRKDGKELPRKTESNLPTESDGCCSLSFKVVLGQDNLFYIKAKPYKKDAPNANRLHTNHIKVPKKNRQYMTKHLKASILCVRLIMLF